MHHGDRRNRSGRCWGGLRGLSECEKIALILGELVDRKYPLAKMAGRS